MLNINYFVILLGQGISSHLNPKATKKSSYMEPHFIDAKFG